MILADKIIDLRKKNGLSQEELAEKMNVSRQSVSKWEGAQSVPDLNKIIMLSEIFGVSTDYLLKDTLDAPEGEVREESGTPLRTVSMEEANSFLDDNRHYASRIALGTLICILAVIPMLALGAVSEYTDREYLAGIGIGAMLCIIAPAVAIFIRAGSSMDRYEYLEKEPIDTAYGVDGMVKERREQYKPVSEKSVIWGVVLCIVGAALFIVGAIVSESFGSAEDAAGAAALCGMLLLVSVGVFLIVRAETVMSGFDRLLENGSFTRDKKEQSGSLSLVGIYWIVLTAAFLAVSFITKRWNHTWLIFAVGGVLTPVVAAFQNSRNRKNK
ncbi:MAG: helix-turn-helix transcriptional regulator [Ruminococcus sp.]|nr:helix-turn-helix transcriptional regulator [Ruminococcus sp.]